MNDKPQELKTGHHELVDKAILKCSIISFDDLSKSCQVCQRTGF